MQVPAKTFELLALGREILMLCESDSDTAALVRGMEGVSCVNSARHGELDSILLDLYRRHVIEGTLRTPPLEQISQYSRDAQNSRFISLLESVTSAPARHPLSIEEAR